MQNLDADRQILSGAEARQYIASICHKAVSTVTVYSAYVTMPGVRWLAENVPEGPGVKIIARWQFSDLTSRASDLEAYPFARDRGWHFGIDPHLHTKAYVVDGRHVLVGSSNLTSNGLGIGGDGNIELSAVVVPTLRDLDRLSLLERSCRWLNDELFGRIRKEVSPHMSSHSQMGFSNEILDQIEKPVSVLWVSELPRSTLDDVVAEDPNSDARADITLFGLEGDATCTADGIAARFRASRVRNWLLQQMLQEPGAFASFGWVTAKLHSALLDEPPPQRRDVKHYVACLFDWVAKCDTDTFEVVKHRRTTSFVLGSRKPRSLNPEG